MASDLSHQLDDDTIFFTEHSLVYHWVHSALEYEKWYIRAKIDFSVTALDLLDPPAFVFRPDRKDQLTKFLGSLGAIRQREAPLPLDAIGVHHCIDVVATFLWLKPCSWFGKVLTM